MSGFEEVVAHAITEAGGTAAGELAFKSGFRVVEVAWKHKFGWMVIRTVASKCVAVLLRRRGKHKVEVIEVRDLNCEGLWHWNVTDHDHAAHFEQMMHDVFMTWR